MQLVETFALLLHELLVFWLLYQSGEYQESDLEKVKQLISEDVVDEVENGARVELIDVSVAPDLPVFFF